MKAFLFIFIISFLSIVDGQRCQGNFNEAITGQCSTIDNCNGTVLDVASCERQRCCVVVEGTLPPPSPICITADNFDILYNTSRATYLRAFLNHGINEAGICNNCQAKAAFLAIAATMTDNFQKDEATGTNADFARDDRKYGNSQPGDGSMFRRRGFFGLRGRKMYERLQKSMPQYQTLTNPESAAITRNAIEIAAKLWKIPDLEREPALTRYADGTFFGFSIIWYKLVESIEQLSDATKQYSKFLRQLQCGGDLYPGQGSTCRYNATHNGTCTPDCIKGLEDLGEYCGCINGKGPQCPNSPVHIRCCLVTCSQELKMDLGFVLDASGSVLLANYQLQLNFTKNLLRQVNVGRNKTHVGIINFSDTYQNVTWLNSDYNLEQKLEKVGKATYFNGATNTALALQQTNKVFSFENGLRQPEEGAPRVVFVITDGRSDNRTATIQAASALKEKEINLISVGVGTELDLVELYAVCTPPASENYFAMANYAALEQKLSQFTSKSCSEPAIVNNNTTVTSEIGKDRYKFLKIEIVAIGNKILVTVKLFNGKVKLFYSFTSRNPKDPADFDDYEVKTSADDQSLWMRLKSHFRTVSKITKAADDEVILVIDKPDTAVEFVYVGVKGVEDDNKFEVKFDDCENVVCPKSSSSTMKLNIVLLFMSALFFSSKVIQ
ncbi:unnamed protein product [Didymodactylos carnosus]|uniref:VWFA domain-containing protein n=1 Tax=Didymodactylos carnosus TaxID=1234261 RepID=A0A815EDZ4_9BILA|nr:unnamed protein product [Didymodactylos carnosus]CAF1310408.1 unnamed protein product [Didymodactylos carnosus]CAF4056947.1 unnamed protein product [Didymodactylos carnosus]CAF4147231.1 unnamed protein product [Didymodactylos carnosus]